MKHRKLLAAIAGVGLLATTACGGSAEPQSESGMSDITIGVLPTAPTAALQLGIDQGFFEDEGINLELKQVQSGNASVPSIVSGEMQFAAGQILTLIQASDNGIDMETVSGFTLPSNETPADIGVWVAKDSGIENVLDLQGKTVSVNAVNSIGDALVRRQVKNAGGDPSKVQFVELGFGDAPAALGGGQIDAAMTPEPFGQVLASKYDAVQISGPYQEIAPEIPMLAVFTSTKYAQQNPEVVEAMRAAVEKTAQYAAANTDAVREAMPEVLDLDEALAENLVLERFGVTIDRQALVDFIEFATAEGIVKGDVDVDKIFPTAQ